MSVGPIVTLFSVDADGCPVIEITFPPGFDRDEALNICEDVANYVLEAANS